MVMDPMSHPVPRAVRIFALVYALCLLGFALAHAEPNCNPYTQATCPTDPIAPPQFPYGPVSPPPAGSTPYNLTSPNLPRAAGGTADMPLPSSRTLMFGNVVTGLDGQDQNYAPFLNLTNGWQPQAFLVTVVSGEESWQQTYDVPAWRHRSINLRDVPILKGKTTGFGVFVQAWGVATASISLHRASDPWGPAYQTIQPDAIQTPQFVAPEPE